VNKKKLIEAVIEKLRADLELYHKAAVFARAEATDEQSKAENKYDTRGLEASYLARGQSRQAAEVGLAIAYFEKLPMRDFGAADPIDAGALVELQTGSEKSLYLLGARAGGTEIEFDGKEVLVITLESPLGSQLAGKKAGDKWPMELAGKKQPVKVLGVW
jgi:hypothetical protein